MEILHNAPASWRGAVIQRYYHPCVGIGLFVKEYIGRYGSGMVIKLENGRKWFAPINEFTLIQ